MLKRAGKFKRALPTTTVVAPARPIEPRALAPVTWASRPGARLSKKRAGDTILLPAFTSAGGSVGTFVGSSVDSVDGSFTYTFTPSLIAATIDGVPYTVRRGSITIHEVNGTQSNGCTFRVEGVAPVNEQTVLLTLGADLIFGGTIQNVTQEFEEITTQLAWNVVVIDWTWVLNRRRPFGTFTEVSASSVVASLWSKYAPAGFTALNVQSGLPAVTITLSGELTFAAVLTDIVNQFGGRWRLGYDKDLHLYLGEVADAPDVLNNTCTTLVRDPQLTSTRDTSQLRNRVFVQGGGTTAADDVAAGSMRIPVTDVDLIPGEQVIVNGQVFNLDSGGTRDSEVAPRAIPPSPVLSQCTDLNAGLYPASNIQVRQSYVYTDGYESPASAPSNVVLFDGTKKLCIKSPRPPDDVVTRRLYVSSVDAPSVPTWTASDTAVLTDLNDRTVESTSADFKGFVIETGDFQITFGPSSPVFGTPGAGSWTNIGGNIYVTPNPFLVAVDGPYSFSAFAGDLIKVHKTGTPGPVDRNINTVPCGMTPLTASWGFGFTDFSGLGFFIPATTGSTSSDGSMVCPSAPSIVVGQAYPSPTPSIVTLASDQVTVSFVCPFAYQFRAQLNPASFSIAGTYTCSVWTKTTLPKGEYRKGNTSMTVTQTDCFSPTGGTAKVGNTNITYTGLVGNVLVGIPATGPGSIDCTPEPASETPPDPETPTADAACGGTNGNGCEAGNGTAVLKDGPDDGSDGPAKNGPTTDPIKKGDPVNIWVQVDDLESQALYGIREYKITDTSLLTVADAKARGKAELDLFSQPIVEIRYSSRDKKTKVGKTVTVNLTNPPLVGTFVIQDVTITQIDEKPNPTGAGQEELNPLYRVQASSVKFTLNDLLRRVIL